MLQDNKLILKALKHQIEFANSNNKFTALVGGFGSGKSAAIPLRVIKLLSIESNPKILVVSPTHQSSIQVLYPLFKEVFSSYNIKYSERKRDRVWTILTPGLEGEVLFKSGRDPSNLLGLNIHHALIDEYDTIPYKKQVELWTVVTSRLRNSINATCAIVTTPEGFKYTYELFVKGIKKDKGAVGKLIKAKTEDNLFLPPDYIQSLRDLYDPRLIEAYLNGDFVNINNDAAYSFDRDKNVIDNPSTFKPMGHHLRVGMDFNIDPICGVVGELEPTSNGKDRLIIFDEIILRNSNTEQMAKTILAKYGHYNRITIYPDLTSLNKRQTNAPLGISDVIILENHGFEIGGNRILRQRDRINTVNGALSHDKVFVTPNCIELIRDLETSDLDPITGGINKKREVKGKPAGHITDAFGYLVERMFPITRINNYSENIMW